MLDTDDARTIANKLQAVIDTSKKNRPHDLAVITHNGIRIAQFGIRRSSHSTGHDHIPRDLHWSPHKCKEMAQCRYGYDDWVKDMILKGIISVKP